MDMSWAEQAQNVFIKRFKDEYNKWVTDWAKEQGLQNLPFSYQKKMFELFHQND